MSERQDDSDRSSDAVIDGIVEIRSRDAVVNKTVTKLEDQIQVEVTRELEDGTFDVSTFRFFLTRSGTTVVPKREVNPESRLIVASALRNAGYDLEM